MGDLGRLLLKNINSWLGLYARFLRGEIGEEEYRRLEEKVSNKVEALIKAIVEKGGG